ncbi:hypothetical protein ACFOUP_07695 [Belliella kenyensis]|uniref:Uncharacterized protein n=1 Tax=Belliella kenyensis TaxID=1472724 RepID=A0ABV8EKT1_9BACT|nr:hypothetical protein [Belliella kenyensis]MCH7400357.1 hypothetical protein [Belliella kenyensis]MDN3604625.1 hypothetical protein [Belliella kenyensis]
MDNIGNVIYVVAIIIYFIYTAIKKGGKDIAQPPSPPENPTEDRPRPQSFEDLLKEIRKGQNEERRDLENTGQGDAHIPNRTKPVQTSSDKYEGEKKYASAFDKYSGTISKHEVPKLQTLDEQVRLSSDLIGIGTVGEDIDKRQKGANRYKKLLQDPQNVKDAVVLSEIMNKKYF